MTKRLMWCSMAALVVVSVTLISCGGGLKKEGSQSVTSGWNATSSTAGDINGKFPGLRVKAVDPSALKVETLLPPPAPPAPYGREVPTYIALYGTGITELSLAGNWSDMIAFAKYTGNYEIFMIDTWSKREQRCTFVASNDLWPAFSPDGSTIAFESMRSGGGDIYLMNPDGSNQRGPIAASSAEELQPSFSPDGNQLVFVSKRDGNSEIYVYDLRTGGLRRVTSSTSEEVDPKFTRDGSKIIFASNFDGDYEICTLPATASSASSTAFTRLTNNTVNDRHPAPNPTPGFPEFVYCSQIGAGSTWELMAYPDFVRITNNNRHDLYPSISPDGMEIVWASYISPYYQLMKMRMGGETSEQLTNASGHCICPCWSGPRVLNRRVYVGPSGVYDQGFAPPFGTSISAVIIGGGGKPPEEIERLRGGDVCAVGIIANTPESIKITALPNVSGQDVLVVDIEADNITRIVEDNGPGNRPTVWVGSDGQIQSVSEVVLVLNGEYAAVVAVIAPSRGKKLQLVEEGSSVLVRGDMVVAQRSQGRGIPSTRGASEVRITKSGKGVNLLVK